MTIQEDLLEDFAKAKFERIANLDYVNWGTVDDLIKTIKRHEAKDDLEYLNSKGLKMEIKTEMPLTYARLGMVGRTYVPLVEET